MPEFSVVISFLEAFGERIGIRNVTAEDIENALINSENSTLVYTVHKNLLKELGKKIGPDNWQRYVRREFIRRKQLNDVLGEYPFTDDEQVIAEDLANQPLFKKRKLDHIPSEDTENPANTDNNNNNIKKDKKREKKRDSDVKEEPKVDEVDLVEQNNHEQKSESSGEIKKDAENSKNEKKEAKEQKEENLSKDGSANSKNGSDSNNEDQMDDNEDSEDQEFDADVSPEEMQKLQREDDDEMDAEDKYVDDEEDLTARRSSRLSKKFLPDEDLDIVRRSSRLTKRKREDEEEKQNGNEDGSDDGDEGSEQEPTAAKKMINTYYHPLSPRTKVVILRNLCEWILDRPSDRVQKEAKALQDTDMQRLRPDPIYIDHKKGDNYWFFGKICEERIFKEHVEEYEYKFKNSAELLQKDGESATIEWTTLSTSLSEVQEFFKSLENDSKAKELKEFINEEILPPLITKQRKKDQAARRAATLDTLGLNRGNILRETRTRRRAAMDSKCLYDIDTILDWDNLK
jgi:hypothetical protein